MSYPVQYCPFCEREISNPGIQRAIQKEEEIWRPTELEPDTGTDYSDNTGTHEPPKPYVITVIR